MVRRGRPSRELVYDRLDTQILELWNRMGGLPDPVQASEIWKGIWFEETHNSTAIEGNTLILKQVEVLLSEAAPSVTRSFGSTWRFAAMPMRLSLQ